MRNDLSGSPKYLYGTEGDEVFDEAMKHLYVEERAEALERRISTLHGHLSVHVDAHHASHSAHLERIIIVLIAVEIVLALLHHGFLPSEEDARKGAAAAVAESE